MVNSRSVTFVRSTVVTSSGVQRWIGRLSMTLGRDSYDSQVRVNRLRVTNIFFRDGLNLIEIKGEEG